MTTKSYNGWTNYETWNVKLWIDNEEGSSLYWAEQAEACLKHHGEDGAYRLSKQLESEHDESLPELSGFAADLLNAAMREVNWFEIAESLIDAAKEEANA